MLALILLACFAAQDVLGVNERSRSSLASPSWRLGTERQSERRSSEKAAREAYESLSDVRKDFSYEEVVAMVKAIKRYEEKYNSRPFSFGGFRITEVLLYTPPDEIRCVHTPKLRDAVKDSKLRSPGWRRFVQQIFMALANVCDEEARRSVAESSRSRIQMFGS